MFFSVLVGTYLHSEMALQRMWQELASEAEIFLSMDHPHVVRLFDVYEDWWEFALWCPFHITDIIRCPLLSLMLIFDDWLATVVLLKHDQASAMIIHNCWSSLWCLMLIEVRLDNVVFAGQPALLVAREVIGSPWCDISWAVVVTFPGGLIGIN